MPKGIPFTEEELEKRRHEIFHRVVKIFLKKGFQETSMREIAEAPGWVNPRDTITSRPRTRSCSISSKTS